MSDNTIRVGDLVMVVGPRSCCAAVHDLGQVFTVSGFFYDGYICSCCHKIVPSTPVALLNGKWVAKAISRLKRIPPLTEPEHTEQEVTA